MIFTGIWKVSWYAITNISALAFDVEYGDFRESGIVEEYLSLYR